MSVQASAVSIPHWFDSSSHCVILFPLLFVVSIPHWFDSSDESSNHLTTAYLGFNSTLVRFKRRADGGTTEDDLSFNSTLVRFKHQ